VRIAVTGGIAEGKSTVLGYLKELGFSVGSADAVAKEVLEHPEVQQALAKALDLPRPVTALALRDRVWGDDEARRTLNSVTHPRIVKAIEAIDAEFLEVPLLIETCLHGRFDAVWVVTCGPEEQLERLTKRTQSEAEARLILESQLPSQVKQVFADLTIRTNAAPDSVNRFVTEAARLLRT
jgi:dephospho-CoA kinase